MTKETIDQLEHNFHEQIHAKATERLSPYLEEIQYSEASCILAAKLRPVTVILEQVKPVLSYTHYLNLIMDIGNTLLTQVIQLVGLKHADDILAQYKLHGERNFNVILKSHFELQLLKNLLESAEEHKDAKVSQNQIALDSISSEVPA